MSHKFVVPLQALLLLVCAAAAAASPGTAEEHDGEPADLTRPNADLLWDAALLALRDRGMTVDAAARNEGRVTSAYHPLDIHALWRFTVSDEGSRPPISAEYRYVVHVGGRPDRARISVRAEIRGTVQDDQAQEATLRALRSNHALEKAFIRAFSDA